MLHVSGPVVTDHVLVPMMRHRCLPNSGSFFVEQSNIVTADQEGLLHDASGRDEASAIAFLMTKTHTDDHMSRMASRLPYCCVENLHDDVLDTNNHA